MWRACPERRGDDKLRSLPVADPERHCVTHRPNLFRPRNRTIRERTGASHRPCFLGLGWAGGASIVGDFSEVGEAASAASKTTRTGVDRTTDCGEIGDSGLRDSRSTRLRHQSSMQAIRRGFLQPLCSEISTRRSQSQRRNLAAARPRFDNHSRRDTTRRPRLSGKNPSCLHCKFARSIMSRSWSATWNARERSTPTCSA